MSRLRVPLLACIAVASLVSVPIVAAAVDEPVLVFAAASLGSVLDEMKPVIERAAGTSVRFSYASSATLARQIEAGAPADVFISADVAWMHYLVGHGLVSGRTVVQIATNRLVLIAPARSTTRLSIAAGFPLREALGTGRLAVGDPASVPAGTYARSALEYFGVWESVRDRLAPGENVRVALQFVARGECPLGIVYASDVKVEPGVRIVDTFPDESVRPGISYPGGLTTSRSNPAAARVLAFLQTREARRTLGRFGFIVEWPSAATP